MNLNVRRRMLGATLASLLAAGACGCTPSDETVSSLVDLAATTSGGFVEIVVRSAAEFLLSLGAGPDLDAPLSEQSH
jgi:hypothetical protein